MNSPIKIKGSLLAKNTILNLIGQIVPLLIAVFTMPYVIRELGAERFGIFSLALVIVGYFSIFEFGLGRAATKFIAEAIGKNEIDRLPNLFWTSLGLQVFFGLIACLLCIVLIPLLTERLLHVPLYLVNEAKTVFMFIAISLPVGLGTGTLRGVLAAAQRFDLINAVKIPSSSLNYLLPAIVLMAGFGLTQIVFSLVIFGFVTALVYFLLCFKVFPILRHGFSFKRDLIRPLFTYGGWVTVSNVVAPVLVYLDRFLIGSLLTMASVTYYTAPYEVVARLWVIPASLTMTVFPAFSALWGTEAKQELERLFVRSVKYILLAVGPLTMLMVFFAPEILGIWLGSDFVRNSTIVFQILSMGILINSLAQVPYSLVQGVGRPDATAKFHLLETPFYVVTAWFLIKNFGIGGAALAWSLRVSLDAFLLFWMTWSLGPISRRCFVENGFLGSLASLIIFASLVFAAVFLDFSLRVKVIYGILAGIISGVVAWRYALDAIDKGIITGAVNKFINPLRVVR